MTQVPASSHGGALPSQWTVGGNGGLDLNLTGASGDHDFAHALRIFNSDASTVLDIDSSGDLTLQGNDASIHNVVSVTDGVSRKTAWDVDANFIRLLDILMLEGTENHSAPADANINAGGLAFWFDQTNGAAKLMVKAKTANGTVVTAAIALA